MCLSPSPRWGFLQNTFTRIDRMFDQFPAGPVAALTVGRVR